MKEITLTRDEKILAEAMYRRYKALCENLDAIDDPIDYQIVAREKFLYSLLSTGEVNPEEIYGSVERFFNTHYKGNYIPSKHVVYTEIESMNKLFGIKLQRTKAKRIFDSVVNAF